MEERLKKMKKSMDNTTFKELSFEKIRGDIYGKVNESDIFIIILQLLVQEKTGYDLVTLIRGRGVRKFEDNEGLIYTYLHKLEQDGCIEGSWNESAIKHYRITNKGRKQLRKAERQTTKKLQTLKEIMGG